MAIISSMETPPRLSGSEAAMIAVVRHPKRKHYHASLDCAQTTTSASDETLTVCTQRMAEGEGRYPCSRCWSPEGYIVIRDHIGEIVAALGVRETA